MIATAHKHFRKIFAPAILFAAFFIPVSAALADQELEFEVHSVRTVKGKIAADRKEDKAEKKTESYPMRVMLGANYISVEAQGRRKIFDFLKRRVYTVNLQSGVYSDQSLYALIGFLSLEYQNRQFLQKALKASGLEGKAGDALHGFDAVFVEHELGLSDKKSDPKIIESSDSQSVLFESKGKQLLSYDKKLHKLDDMETIAYIRFLRYAFIAHPTLLDKLKALNGIPRSVKLSKYAPNSEFTVILKSARNSKSVGYSLDGMSLGLMPEDKAAFSAFLFKQLSAKEDVVRREQTIRDQVEPACKAGRYVDCFLGSSEWSLQTGIKIFPQKYLPGTYRSLIGANAEFRELRAAINPPSKEGVEKAVSTLAKLREHSADKQHVLKVFEANHWVKLRKSRKAVELFHEALQENPFLTSAYKDLGDAYYADYQTGLAWQSWDFGRKLYPNHWLFEPVNEFEKKLAATYPEFF